ncbi:MAG: MarR family winged helix-turn-helix transcriptional regulator [Hyphomicrobium sp.]
MVNDLLLRDGRGFYLSSSPMHLLHRLNQRASEIFDGQIKDGLLTALQFTVLLVVSKEEGLSQTALVQRTGIDRSTLADIVKRLINKGLLNRQRTKQDARAYSVKLTENGSIALRVAGPVARSVDETILSRFPDGQRERFISDLKTILNGLENNSLLSP